MIRNQNLDRSIYFDKFNSVPYFREKLLNYDYKNKKIRDLLYYSISKDGKVVQFTIEPKTKKRVAYKSVTYLGRIEEDKTYDTYKNKFVLNFTGLGNLVLEFTHDTISHTHTLQIFCDNGRNNRYAQLINSIIIQERDNLVKKDVKIDIVFERSLLHCFQMSKIKSAAIKTIMKKKTGLKF